MKHYVKHTIDFEFAHKYSIYVYIQRQKYQIFFFAAISASLYLPLICNFWVAAKLIPNQSNLS